MQAIIEQQVWCLSTANEINFMHNYLHQWQIYGIFRGTFNRKQLHYGGNSATRSGKSRDETCSISA